MAKLIDFKCKYVDFQGISSEVAKEHGLTIPDAYMHADTLVKLAGDKIVFPFDPVLEAENLGADIKFDASSLGPRKNTDVINDIAELAELPVLDVTKGRLAETLKAVKIMNDSGKSATVELHGPITIINGLTDIMKVLIKWRKNPEAMDAFFKNLIDGLTEYALAAREAGCRIIYYTDSAGSLNILGPKYSKQITENFTVPFLKNLDEKLPDDCVIHLCPKTSFLLAGTESAVWKKIHFDEPIPYKEACLAVCGKARVLGQRCRKDTDIKVNVINYLELL